MTECGPTNRSLDERIDTLSEEVRELSRSVREFGNDLRWIKRIGVFIAGLLVAAIAGAGRVIWEAATIAADVRQQGKSLDHQDGRLIKLEGRVDGVEKRLDGIDQKLDTLIHRTESKAGVDRRPTHPVNTSKADGSDVGSADHPG